VVPQAIVTTAGTIGIRALIPLPRDIGQREELITQNRERLTVYNPPEKEKMISEMKTQSVEQCP